MDTNVEGLAIERDRLLNAVDHLVRSNEEIKACLQETGHDPELRQAVGENIVVIAKYKAKIQKIQEELRKSQGPLSHVLLPQTVTSDEPDLLEANTPSDFNIAEETQFEKSPEGGVWL